MNNKFRKGVVVSDKQSHDQLKSPFYLYKSGFRLLTFFFHHFIKQKMPKAKPLTLNGLNGSYVLSSDIRDSLSIPPNILCSEVSSWRSVKSVVDNYFKSTNKPRNFASHALDEILDALQVIKNMEADKKFHLQLKRYASKVSAFLRDTDNKEEFKEIYKRMNMQRQVQVTRENAIQQGVITGNILAENGARVLAESLQASESDQENEDEISDVENNIFDDNHGEVRELEIRESCRTIGMCRKQFEFICTTYAKV